MNLAEQNWKKKAKFCTGVSKSKRTGLRVPSPSLLEKKSKPCYCRNSNFYGRLNWGGEQAALRAAGWAKPAFLPLYSSLRLLPCVAARQPGGRPGGSLTSGAGGWGWTELPWQEPGERQQSQHRQSAAPPIRSGANQGFSPLSSCSFLWNLQELNIFETSIALSKFVWKSLTDRRIIRGGRTDRQPDCGNLVSFLNQAESSEVMGKPAPLSLIWTFFVCRLDPCPI